MPYGGCGVTKYAGIMEFGLYHVDHVPEGAPGFQQTDSRRLVDGDALVAQPPQGFGLY